MAEPPDELDTRYQLLAFGRTVRTLGILALVINLAIMAVPFTMHPWYLAIFWCLPNFAAACVLLFVALPRLRASEEKLKGNRPPE